MTDYDVTTTIVTSDGRLLPYAEYLVRELRGARRARPFPVERRQHGTVRSRRKFKIATASPTRKRAGGNTAARRVANGGRRQARGLGLQHARLLVRRSGCEPRDLRRWR